MQGDNTFFTHQVVGNPTEVRLGCPVAGGAAGHAERPSIQDDTHNDRHGTLGANEAPEDPINSHPANA